MLAAVSFSNVRIQKCSDPNGFHSTVSEINMVEIQNFLNSAFSEFQNFLNSEFLNSEWFSFIFIYKTKDSEFRIF